MTTKAKSKGIMMLDVYFAGAFILVAVAGLIVIQVFFTNRAVETLKFSEEVSVVDTHLYVLLNNNHCTPNTKLPLKEVIAAALSLSTIPDIDDPVKIEYNGNSDTLKIGECIESYARRLYIDSYQFYVTYGDRDYFKIGKDSKDMSKELEDIVVPKGNSIATAVLMIETEPVTDTEKTECLGNDDLYCVQEKTCLIFGGICKRDYQCGINQCCCKDLPV